MIYTKRTLVVLAGITALAASSHATISFSGTTSYETVSGNEVTVANPSLTSGTLVGSTLSLAGGVYTLTDTFDVKSTGTLITAAAQNVTSGVRNGVLSLGISLDGTSFYNSIRAAGPGPYKGLAGGSLATFSLAANTWYTVSYTATYASSSAAGKAYINSFALSFTDSTPPPPVPEPASFGAVSLGLVGLVARRRKGVK